MIDILLKSHEMIQEQQRKADSKSYIFIILQGSVLSFIWSMVKDYSDLVMILGALIIIFLILVSISLLVVSIVPIYSSKPKVLTSNNDAKINVFYWKTMLYSSVDVLVTKIKEKYGKSFLSEYELDLIKQVYANSQIMSRKARLQKAAMIVTLNLLLLLSFSFAYSLFEREELAYLFLIIIFAESLYLVFK